MIYTLKYQFASSKRTNETSIRIKQLGGASSQTRFLVIPLTQTGAVISFPAATRGREREDSHGDTREHGGLKSMRTGHKGTQAGEEIRTMRRNANLQRGEFTCG